MSEQVDLSLCQPGDVCHLRSRGTTPFDGPNRESSDVRRKEFPFAAGGVGFRRDGRFMRDRESAYDIVRVTRDGQTITPVPVAGEQAAKAFDYQSMDAQVWAAEFCRIFPGHDEGTMLAWFANAIMAGFDEATRRAAQPAAPIEPADDPDLLTFLEQAGAGCISGRVADWPQLKPACKWAAEEIKRLREAVQPAATGEGEIGETDTVAEQLQMKIGRLEGELETYRRASTYWWMHYCKASGREPHTTVAADAEYIREFDAIRDALWVCMKHNELHHGENHNTVIQAASALNGWQPSAPPSPPAEEQCCLCGSPMNAGSCTGDPDGCVMVVTDKPAEVPQAVITGPGKYVNKWGDVATIIGPAGDLWVGYFEDSHGHKTAYLFESDGKKHTTYVAFAGSLTGPYAPPRYFIRINDRPEDYRYWSCNTKHGAGWMDRQSEETAFTFDELLTQIRVMADCSGCPPFYVAQVAAGKEVG